MCLKSPPKQKTGNQSEEEFLEEIKNRLCPQRTNLIFHKFVIEYFWKIHVSLYSFDDIIE